MSVCILYSCIGNIHGHGGRVEGGVCDCLSLGIVSRQLKISGKTPDQ